MQGRRADGGREHVPRLVSACGQAGTQARTREASASDRLEPRAPATEPRRREGRGGPQASKNSPLALVRDQIVSCDRCPRLRAYCERIEREKRRAYREEAYWARPVPGFGDPRARLLIVGLAPAAHGANRTGRLFTGDGVGGSGDFLMSALYRAGFANIPTSHHPNDGLKLHDAFIAAAVRCAPPDNSPTRVEIATCLAHLEAETDALPRVSVVLVLGKIAFDAYLQLLKRRKIVVRPRPQFGHAASQPLPGGQLLVGCYHPSRQNTNTGRLTPGMMDEVFRKVKRILRVSLHVVRREAVPRRTTPIAHAKPFGARPAWRPT